MSTISRMINDSQDPDKHLWPAEPPEAHQTVLDFFSAENEEECESHIYKYTNCGAWIEFFDRGIRIGSIVEGCDFGTMIYPLYYSDEFTSADIQARIDAVEKEAEAIWDWANEPRDILGRRHRYGKTDEERGCDAPDIYQNYDFEIYGRSC